MSSDRATRGLTWLELNFFSCINPTGFYILPRYLVMYLGVFMMHPHYRRRPAPDDGLPVPLGHMRCCVHDHEGPRIISATLEFFRGRSSSPNGIGPVCRACRHRERKKRWLEVEKPQRPVHTLRKSPSENALLIARGSRNGKPVRLPKGTMICSWCYRLLPHNPRYFDPTKPYRIEPKCLDCQNGVPLGTLTPPI